MSSRVSRIPYALFIMGVDYKLSRGRAEGSSLWLMELVMWNTSRTTSVAYCCAFVALGLNRDTPLPFIGQGRREPVTYIPWVRSYRTLHVLQCCCWLANSCRWLFLLLLRLCSDSTTTVAYWLIPWVFYLSSFVDFLMREWLVWRRHSCHVRCHLCSGWSFYV